MSKFEFLRKKSCMIIFLICVIFIFMIANSFRYLSPSNTTQSRQNLNEEQSNVEEFMENSEERTKYDNRDDVSFENTKTVEKVDVIDKKEEKITEIPELESINSSTEEIVKEISPLERAKQFLQEKKFESAVYEYQKMAESSSDAETQADCYYKISYIYGIMKRYGTAISYAQKAYMKAPSTERELLLARLYYKTGNAEKANQYISEILRRDFSND